jgi:hypothetical protein
VRRTFPRLVLRTFCPRVAAVFPSSKFARRAIRAGISLFRPVANVVDLALLGNRELQEALRRNLVCFPAQAPVFGKPPRRDVQWRLAVLYFVRHWPTRLIADRYHLTRERCGQIISDWRVRAIALGYIQDVTQNGLDTAMVLPAGVNQAASAGDTLLTMAVRSEVTSSASRLPSMR